MKTIKHNGSKLVSSDDICNGEIVWVEVSVFHPLPMNCIYMNAVSQKNVFEHYLARIKSINHITGVGVEELSPEETHLLKSDEIKKFTIFKSVNGKSHRIQ